MRSNNTYVKIDGEKLRKILDEKELVRAEASRRVGYNDSYLTCAIKRNVIRKNVTEMLDILYGIKLSDYEWTVRTVDQVPPKKVDEPKEEDSISEEIWKKLHDCVYSAVYEAVKKAWAE